MRLFFALGEFFQPVHRQPWLHALDKRRSIKWAAGRSASGGFNHDETVAGAPFPRLRWEHQIRKTSTFDKALRLLNGALETFSQKFDHEPG
ncbi:MAG: hypothetical protein JWP99_1333 [Devosia sp.]|nr:hypothetical protein [Devosia sp.]